MIMVIIILLFQFIFLNAGLEMDRTTEELYLGLKTIYYAKNGQRGVLTYPSMIFFHLYNVCFSLYAIPPADMMLWYTWKAQFSRS